VRLVHCSRSYGASPKTELTCTVRGPAECRCRSVALFLDHLVASVRKGIVDGSHVNGARGRGALAEVSIWAMSTGGSAGVHDATMRGLSV
jgi:hypothetical protein